MVFHFAPNTAEPSGVITLTTCEGGSTGAANGRGASGAAGAAGACAVAIVGTGNGNATSAARASSRIILGVRMF